MRGQGRKRSRTFSVLITSPLVVVVVVVLVYLFVLISSVATSLFLTFETPKLCRRRTDTFKRDANRVGRFIRFSIIGVHRWRNDEKERRKYVLRRYPSFRFNQREGFSPSIDSNQGPRTIFPDRPSSVDDWKEEGITGRHAARTRRRWKVACVNGIKNSDPKVGIISSREG